LQCLEDFRKVERHGRGEEHVKAGHTKPRCVPVAARKAAWPTKSSSYEMSAVTLGTLTRISLQLLGNRRSRSMCEYFGGGKAWSSPLSRSCVRPLFPPLVPASRGVSGQPCRRGYDWMSPERLKVNRTDKRGSLVSGVRCASVDDHVSCEL
jgi:hypothetical protein